MMIDISIPLKFDGEQPNAFGVESARAETIGDTRDGASVNFARYTFIPHCNGTHTECVGHITDERISVRECLQDVIIPALLVSVEPERVEGDLIISAGTLRSVLKPDGMAFADDDVRVSALIVRTLPNDENKLTASYGEGNVPAYFEPDAMRLIVEMGFTHLLCDLPSIDRIYDGGVLACHRIFWNVEPGSRAVSNATRINSTITELIYVPNEIADGEYQLNLQIAPFDADCSPSRPIIFAHE